MSGEDVIDDRHPHEVRGKTKEERIDYVFGLEAGKSGAPNDDSKSPAWQRGWADAKK
jgi:hypothetical protein